MNNKNDPFYCIKILKTLMVEKKELIVITHKYKYYERYT